MIKQLQANQLAITDGFEKINETNEKFLDMRELPTPEGDYQEPTTSQSAIEKPKKNLLHVITLKQNFTILIKWS